jgi:hypothetical protein
MVQHMQTITLLICFQSSLGHASKQPNTCAAVAVRIELESNACIRIKIDLRNESSANRNFNIPLTDWTQSGPAAVDVAPLPADLTIETFALRRQRNGTLRTRNAQSAAAFRMTLNAA